MSLMETYPEAIVGKSTFSELRPAYMLSRADTPRNVCLCKYHENTKLFLDCAHKHVPRQAFRSVENYIDAVVCNRHNAKCMMNDCDECCDGRKFLQLTSNIPEEEKEIATS